MAVEEPELAQRPGQPQHPCRVAGPLQPGEGRPQVVEVGLDPVQPLQERRDSATKLSQNRSARSTHQAAWARRVASSSPLACQLLQPELADRLQHPVARTSPSGSASGLVCSRALVDQRPEPLQDVDPGLARRGDHRLGRLQGAAADEDGQPPEQRLLLGREQVVAPGDGVAHRPQPGGQVARPAGRAAAAAAPAGPAAPPAAAGRSAPRPARSPAAARRGGGRSRRPPARSPAVRREVRRAPPAPARRRGGPPRSRASSSASGRRPGSGSASGGTGKSLLAGEAQDGPAGDEDARGRARRRAGRRPAAAAGSTCSKLSSTRSRCRVPRGAASRPRPAAGRPPPARRGPARSPRRRGRGRGSRRGGRRRRRRRSPRRGASATRRARRVLPTPPGPVRVRRRTPSSPSRAQTAAASRSRPISGVSGTGRLGAGVGGGVAIGCPDPARGRTADKRNDGRWAAGRQPDGGSCPVPSPSHFATIEALPGMPLPGSGVCRHDPVIGTQSPGLSPEFYCPNRGTGFARR